MGLDFEGDIAGFDETQFDLFREVFNKLGYEEGIVTIEPVGKVGDNYLANIKRLTIEGKEGPFKLVAKVAPKQAVMRTMSNTTIVFQNETFMYTEVLPKLRELQKSVDIPDDELLRYPACYGVLDEVPNEIIILEDLKELGFGIRNKFNSLKDEEVRLMLKNLAVLHALGFILKAREPEFFEHSKNKLMDLWKIFSKHEDFQKGLATAEVGALELLDSELHRELTKGKLTGLWSFLDDLGKKEENSPHLTIIQGDCWVNNIMFKDNIGKTEGCIMIDYQLSRVTSPIVDLMYFIFNSTDIETRKDNYFKWIEFYYGIFSRTLGRFGMVSSDVYSRVDIHKDLKNYGQFLYGFTAFFLNILMRDSDEIVDIKALTDEEFKEEMEKIEEFYNVKNLKSASIERYKKRLQGLAESFVEYGYI